MRVKILPLQIGDILGWHRNVVMPARISSVQRPASRVESRIENRVSSCESAPSSILCFTLPSELYLTMTCMYSSREVCLLYTPHPNWAFLHPPHSHNPHNSSPPDLLFSTPIGPDNALAILHASRAHAVQGVSRRSGANIARLGRRHSNYGGEGVQYPNIPEQKGRALLIHERAREEDDM